MTSKPKRSTTPAVSLTTEGGFWTALASYATELAPVAGPLLEAIGHTAKAIGRADHRNRYLEAALDEDDWE